MAHTLVELEVYSKELCISVGKLRVQSSVYVRADCSDKSRIPGQSPQTPVECLSCPLYAFNGSGQYGKDAQNLRYPQVDLKGNEGEACLGLQLTERDTSLVDCAEVDFIGSSQFVTPELPDPAKMPCMTSRVLHIPQLTFTP